MKKLILLMLFIGCGKTIKTGSIEKTQEPVINSTQFANCVPPRTPDIVYMGIPCNFNQLSGANYLYICANNRHILVDCQGRVL